MKKYITKQSSIKGAGKGLFTNTSFKKGELIGLAHVNGEPTKEVGSNHNHNEKNPTANNIKNGNKRYLIASRNLKPGEEITTNYRLQPELEQPEDFEKKKDETITPQKDGYRTYSPFKNLPYIDVESDTIDSDNIVYDLKLRANNGLTKFIKKNTGLHTLPGAKVIREIPVKRKGGSLLTKKVTCKSCGWKWDAEDGGNDITTCHKCGGQGLIHAQGGGNTDAMTGMMKARLAYANEFGNPAAERMINLPDNPYQFDNGDTGTHYMASMDNYAVPQIQDENGVLQLGDYGPESNEAIRFDSDEDANYFAENYKDVSPGFIEAELDEDEIEEYRKGGYIVEEIDNYQDGGVYTVKGSKGNYKKVNGKWQVDWNRSGKYQPLSKGDVKARTAVLDKIAKPLYDKDYDEMVAYKNLSAEDKINKFEPKKELTKEELKNISNRLGRDYKPENTKLQSVEMVYPEKYLIGPGGGMIGGLLKNPYVMGASNAYFGAEGINEWADSNSDLRKSISKAWDDPTGSNIGDFGYELGLNALNFSALPFGKYYKNYKNIGKTPISKKYSSFKPRKPKTINLNQNPGWLQLPKVNSKSYFEYKKLKYQNGGHVELDLTPEEIKKYVNGGYVVEEIDNYQNGGVNKKGKSYDYTRDPTYTERFKRFFGMEDVDDIAYEKVDDKNIKKYNVPVNKFKENYVYDMPNVRTKKDDSYKAGHKLKNEIKNFVLHHIAYDNPITNEAEVKKQFMTPGQNSSHVVIEEDGSRTIYASPEQVSFHAGKSKWNGREDVNDFSIGVEFQGDTQKKPLTDQQVISFVEYYAPIAKKYNLNLKSIITHEQIRNAYIKKHANEKGLETKPDITYNQYKRILNYMKAKGIN
jgi:predicted Zn-ribbon and HTH transcriptional regulator